MAQQQQLHDIVTPHEHDVLSGRGNFVNYHAGNEHFRALVRKHKVAYVACPKPQKGKFSRMIYDEIRARNPPGRFLKQDAETKLWHDIGEKKALDKTRQALREGAPEISKEITGGGDSDDEGLPPGVGGYGVPTLKSEMASTGPIPQHSINPALMQQLPNQMAGGASHTGQMFASQAQRLQQQQQQQRLQQQQQQQQLARQLGASGVGQLGGQMGGQMGVGGGMGGLGNMGGNLGGMGVNPYGNFQMNSFDDQLEPTPLQGQFNQMNQNLMNQNRMSQLNQQNRMSQTQMTQNQQLQAQMHAQAQLQAQQAQLQSQLQAQAHRLQPQSVQSQPMPLQHSHPRSPRNSAGTKIKRALPEHDVLDSSDHSLGFDNAFDEVRIEQGVLGGEGGAGPNKEKQKMGGSSTMSFMSLNMSAIDDVDTAGAGDLSAMFDSSLQISEKRISGMSQASVPAKGGLFDMSVNTIGEEGGKQRSPVGGLNHSALGGEVEDSQAGMSFSDVFEES